jgi:large subunit ribosomal protein L23
MTVALRHRILLHAYVTEKSMDEMERLNKLEFMVDRRATRAQVKDAVQSLYQCKVSKVNTRIVRSGKIATVTFAKGFSAEDIGGRAGVF